MCDIFTVGRCARSSLLAVSHDEERLLLAGNARSSVTSWSRCLVVIDLISVQTLFVSGKLFSERGGRLSAPWTVYQRNIYEILIKEIYHCVGKLSPKNWFVLSRINEKRLLQFTILVAPSQRGPPYLGGHKHLNMWFLCLVMMPPFLQWLP